MTKLTPVILLIIALTWTPAIADEIDDGKLNLIDVFQLEYAADPQISPDGERVVYVRSFMDIMADRRRSNLWIVNADGSSHRPLTTGSENHHSPRWSPDGDRLLYLLAGVHDIRPPVGDRLADGLRGDQQHSYR